ncbi:DNA-binding protein, excisionase family [Mycobacterium sp. JS623]|uniref:helix-turn-helix domain-containing protein n=1 Tax=Mycobacterium sp. JS623 TaxID=212767 RepID=UPI0002A58DC5|nr:DNA-binding protein, excisionase family [Mycobacterium sp. JS623]
MSTAIDIHTRRLLRVLGETALRLSDGQPVDHQWLERQLSAAVLAASSTVGSESNLLTVPEACAQLRISRWSFYRLIQQQRLTTVTIGRRRLVPQAELERFVSILSETGGAA